jgi:hypothetical protein
VVGEGERGNPLIIREERTTAFAMIEKTGDRFVADFILSKTEGLLAMTALGKY